MNSSRVRPPPDFSASNGGSSDMNPYAMLASGTRTSSASSLALRLTAWHDEMVAHERRLRTAGTGGGCDEECPHVTARMLWAEALVIFGRRAYELTFLQSRATDQVIRSIAYSNKFAKAA